MTKEKLVSFVKQCQTYYLATIDEHGKPSLRPFGTFSLIDDRIYIQTGKRKSVYQQIISSPFVALCAFDGKAWVRLTAEAFEVEDIKIKALLLDEYPALKEMYSAADPNTIVFRLDNIHGEFIDSEKEDFQF